MSFDEACELSSFGSKILHPATMLPAMARSIPVRVRNTRDPAAPGTRVVTHAPGDGTSVRAIGHRAAVTLATVSSDRSVPQHAFLARVFEAIAAREIDIGPVAISEGALRFACTPAEATALLPVLQSVGSIEVLTDKAIVGIVGTGPAMAGRIAADALATLTEAGIPVECATLGARGGTVALLVANADLTRTVRALHDRFFP
jgi:aspartate kinase